MAALEPLREIAETRQYCGEPKRRWFTNGVVDLIVFGDVEAEPVGFQLCYPLDTEVVLVGKEAEGANPNVDVQLALTWSQDDGFQLFCVDDGESGAGRHQMTPTLLPLAHTASPNLLDWFIHATQSLNECARDFVLQRLNVYFADAYTNDFQVSMY